MSNAWRMVCNDRVIELCMMVACVCACHYGAKCCYYIVLLICTPMFAAGVATRYCTTQATLTETVTASTLSGTDATLVSAAHINQQYFTMLSEYPGMCVPLASQLNQVPFELMLDIHTREGVKAYTALLCDHYTRACLKDSIAKYICLQDSLSI
jgi:hypothetical protein